MLSYNSKFKNIIEEKIPDQSKKDNSSKSFNITSSNNNSGNR